MKTQLKKIKFPFFAATDVVLIEINNNRDQATGCEKTLTRVTPTVHRFFYQWAHRAQSYKTYFDLLL